MLMISMLCLAAIALWQREHGMLVIREILHNNVGLAI